MRLHIFSGKEEFWGVVSRRFPENKKISRESPGKGWFFCNIVLRTSQVFVRTHTHSLIWMNGHATRLARLQTLQNRCLRLVLGVDNRFSREALYRTLEVKNLKERWETHGLILIFKLLHNLAPPSLSSRIEFKSQSNYTLRSNNTQIVLPRPRTNFVNSSLYSASKLFNSLAINLRTINDIKIFAKEIKKTSPLQV